MLSVIFDVILLYTAALRVFGFKFIHAKHVTINYCNFLMCTLQLR